MLRFRIQHFVIFCFTFVGDLDTFVRIQLGSQQRLKTRIVTKTRKPKVPFLFSFIPVINEFLYQLQQTTDSHLMSLSLLVE
jgi:hypothetical protein